MGVALIGDCDRCRLTGRLDYDLHLCGRCLGRVLDAHRKLRAPVPEYPTEIQALTVFIMEGYDVILSDRINLLRGTRTKLPP